MDLLRKPRTRHAGLMILLLCGGLLAILWVGIWAQFSAERRQAVTDTSAENADSVRLLAEDVLRTIRVADLTLGEIAALYRRDGRGIDLVRYAADRRLYL